MKNAVILPLPPAKLAALAASALQLAPARLALAALAGDAGSRRYYRATIAGSDKTYLIATDSAPAQQKTFVRLRAHFAAAGVTVPAIHAQQPGFLLLDDFGDVTYRRHLPADADALYAAAIRTLIKIQRSAALAAALPPYRPRLLADEMRLYADWYCARHLRRPLGKAAARVVAAAARLLIAEITALPAVAVHRDYHARNLMLLPAARAPGVLDFQDAVAGNPLYDVVSLLRDAYIEWPAETQRRWLSRYRRAARAAGIAAGDSADECRRQFNLVGAQRGLKVLGIFARLLHRDGKRQYIADLPLAHRHLQAACDAVPSLSALAAVVADHPPEGAGVDVVDSLDAAAP